VAERSHVDDARHSFDWYDQAGEALAMQPGDLLVDDGPREEWRYVFVPRTT
jgi:hypothetical protein